MKLELAAIDCCDDRGNEYIAVFRREDYESGVTVEPMVCVQLIVGTLRSNLGWHPIQDAITQAIRQHLNLNGIELEEGDEVICR